MVFLAAEGCRPGGFSMFGRLMAPFWESRDVGTGWESGIIGWAVAAPEQHQAVHFSNWGGPGVGQVLARQFLVLASQFWAREQYIAIILIFQGS